jgi:formamidopyrimidine-DNA glycosylase
MPELPEVEILVRHLGPMLKGKMVRHVDVRRAKVIAPTSARKLSGTLRNAKFTGVTRRGKYLLFTLRQRVSREPILLVGHLGMTGRMYLLPKQAPLPRHAAVVMDLGRHQFVYEDTRYFGRLTLDTAGCSKLGPEPLGAEFTADYLTGALRRSAQSIKVKLLDQTLVAGVGNIYASEALFRAGISPKVAANRLTRAQVRRLCQSVRKVLEQAIRCGSTLPLDFGGNGSRDGLFYYGATGEGSRFYQERLRVYDRGGKPCVQCGGTVRRIVQAARSTFYCPRCQRH